MPPGYVLQWLPLELMGVVAAMAAGIWAWKVALRPAYRWAKGVKAKLEEFFESWFGRPARPGYPAEPGVPERLATYDERIEGMTTALGEHADAIADIRYHVQPNRDGSAHDDLIRKVDAVGDRLGFLTDSQLALARVIDELRTDKERAHEKMLRRIGRMEHHPAGEES